MSYANPLEFRPVAISAGKGAYLTVELGKATTTPVGHGILGLNDFEFKAEFNSDADAGISSWENILGPRQSTIPDFSASWSGYYTTTNSENVALTGTGDDYLGFTVNGQAQATSFTPQAIPAINEIGVIYYNSPGDASLRDVSLDYTRYFLSPLNAARFLNDSEISAHEPASDSISELFTIHADSFADHTVYLKSADISPGSRSGIDTEAFTRGGETTNFGDDYRLYWGKSGLTSPSAEQLTLIQPNGDSFTWGTSAQDESVDFQQISIYAEILSDNFAEQHQAAEITAWGGAGKVTYEWTAPQSDNTSFWRAIGEDFYNTTYLGGQWSGPYAVGGSGAYLSETVSLAGFGGRIELDVLFGDSWDGESLQIYVNGNNFNFSRIYSSQVGQSTQSNNGYIATLYPYNDYGQTVGAAWNDQTARVSIEIPIGVTSVTLGAGETLDQAWSDEFLGIDNLAVIEPEVTTYTLKAPDDDPVLSLGRVGYLDGNNKFVDTNGSITEGVIGVVEIDIADEAGNSAFINNPAGLYVHYMVSSSGAVEGDDFFAPKGVMSTKDYSVTDFIKVDPGSSKGYLYISAKEDAIIEGEEAVTITLLDNIWTTDSGLTYQNYVIGDNASVSLNIADADGQRWSQGVSFSQQGRTDSYIRADEDGSSNIDVRLRSQPEGIVTLYLSTGDALTFTDEDWDTPQTISVILSDNTNGGEAITASSSDGEWSGSGFVNSYTDPLVPAVVLYEGGQIVEEGTRVAVTAQEEIVEGSSSKTAALTFSRVSQDSSATFEVFFTAEKTTEGSAYTNPAILTGEKIRSYQPLVLSDENAPITYTGNSGAGATGGAYTIEFWINPTESNGNNISPISLQDKYGNKTSIEISGDGSISFVNTTTAGRALAMNQWQHVAITRSQDAATNSIFVNGRVVGTGAASEMDVLSLTDNEFELVLGGAGSALIRDVRIFDTERSEEEVKADMLMAPATTSDLIFSAALNGSLAATISGVESTSTDDATFSEDQLYGALFGSGDSTVNAYINSEEDSIDYGLTTFAIEIQGDNEYAIVGADTSSVSLADNDHSTLEFYKQNNVKKFFLAVDTGSVAELIGNASIVAISNPGTAGLEDLSTALAFGQSGGAALPEFTPGAISEGLTVQGWLKVGASSSQDIINLLDENGEGLILSVASDGLVTLKLPTGADQITYVGEDQVGVGSWNHWSLSVSSDGIPSLFLNAEELGLKTDLDTAATSDLLKRVLTSNTIGTTTAEGDEAASSYAAGFRALSGERSTSDIATDMSQGSIPLTPELIYAIDASNVSSIESKTSIAAIIVQEEDSVSWSALSSDVTLQQSQAIVDSNGTIVNSTLPTSLTLGIALSSQPFGTVSLSLDNLSSTVNLDYLSITIDDSQDGNLIFTAENWDIPQSVTLKTTGDSLGADLSQVLSFEVNVSAEDENYNGSDASLALTLLASLPSQPDDASSAGDYSSAYTVAIGAASNVAISEADSSQTQSLTISLLDSNSRTAITRDRDTLVLIGQSGKSTATTADIDFDNPGSDILSGLIILEDSGTSSKAISVTTSLDNVKDLQDGAMLRGYIEIKKTGYYTFYGTTNGNTTISINEKDVLTLNAESNEASGYTDPILLDAGSYIPIAIDQASGDSLSLQWIEPDAEDNNATSITSLSQVGQLHVVIPAGEGSASLVAKAIDDDIAEATENFTIELQQEIPYQLEFDTSQLTSAKGMQLEDQSSYLSLPGITTGTGYTIAGWINLANANQINTLFYADSGTTNADRISLRTTPTGAIQFGTWNSSKNSQIQIVSESQLVDEGVWHHLVASVSEEQATLYLDGVQVGSQSLSSSSDSGLRSRVRLGYGANSNESLSGFIRDYQLFNQALSADDIETIYSKETGSSDLKDLGIQDWYSLASAVGTHYGQDGSESTALGVEVGSPQFVDWYSAPFLYTESISTLFSIQAGDSLAFGGDTSEGTSGEWILEFINDEELVQGISSDLAFRIAETSSQDILPDNTTLTAEHVSGGYQLPTTSSTDATGNATEVIEVGKIQGSISIEDNDSAGFFISGGASLTLIEGGGSSMRSLNLTSQPLDSVTLYLQAAKEGEITLSAAEGTAGAAVADTFYLTFTEEDWSTPQDFYIQAVNNQTADGERNFNLHITSASDDSNYHKLSTLSEAAGITPFDVTIDDDDTAGLDFVAIANNITKAANGYVYVALATQPSGDVTLTATPKDGSFTLNDRSINRSEELVFTSVNWNVPQSLELTAIDDSLATGTQVSQVDFEFSSKSDSKYTGSLAIDALNVYIIDNDLPTASIISVLDATENARPGAFKIILDEAAPEDPGSTGVIVDYSITGFDLDQYLQSITLSDGTVEEFPITDEDGDFDGDNASEADLLKALGIYTISPGGNLLGSVRIAPGESESNIFVIPIDEIFADKFSLDTGTSQTGRTGKRIGIELTQSSNTDPLLFDSYRLSADASKRSTSVDIINNDVAGVAIISSGSLLQTSEDLGYQDDGATFAVVLLTQPKADVLISINEAARIEAESLTGIDGDPEKNEEELTYVKNENGSLTTGSGNTMTFTAANWYIPQTATVVAKADNMIEDGSSESGYSETGIHSTSIAFVFNSADTDYDTSYNQDDAEHFTANTSLGVLIQDQSLPTTTAEALSSTLDSLQSGFESLELPFLGKMDGKFGSPFSSLFSELIPNIRSLGDQLTAKRLQNVLNDYFSNVIVELQEGASVIDVSFEYDQEYDLLSIPLDAELGIPALGLQASGSIDSSIALATKLGLQVPFATDATSDIAIRLDEDSTSIGAQLDLAFSEDFELDGGLGFLQFNANNQDSPRNDSATGLSSEFTISLAGSDATTLSYADLSSKDFNLSEYVDFTFPTDAGASSANLSLHVNTQSSAGAVMPSVNFDLTVELPVFNYGDTDDANSNVAQVYFDNINLDIGSFATDMLLPAVQVIGDVLDPIKPLVDAFYTDTKIFDALGMTSAMDSDGDGIVTPLDMLIVYADNFGTSSDQKNAQKAKIFLSTLQQVYSVIDTFESLEEGEGFGINLGDYSFELAAASKDSSKSAAAQPTPVIDSAQGNTKSTALSVNDKIGSAINELYALGFSIPLIESPSTAVSLLMGQDIDLFTWTMPGMSASLSPSQTFNLYPAPLIQGTIGGEFGAEAFITLGFDTSGFSAWADTGFALDQSWRAFDGFFVDDWDSNGNDRDEVTVSADLGVDVSASIALAKASAGGGVSANMGFDLIDSGQFNGTSDGKLRASEIFSRISNPLNLFELTGDLSAYLDGSVKVGVDLGFYKKWWTVWSEQFDFDLFSFSLSGSGSSSNGPIQDATVFFDANSNGRIDASESATTTLANGTYADLKLDLRAIDTNRNGLIDAEEGRLVAFGGTDTIGSIPVDTVMFAPYGSQINPLSSLYTTALGAGFTTQEAKARVQSLFSIDGWDFTQLDPTRILRELADTSTEDELIALAKQAAIAHSFLNWSFSKLIVQAEKIKGIASLSIGEKIALSESFLQRLLAEDEQDVSTGMAEKISRSLLQEWRNYADVNNLGQDLLPDKVMLSSQINAIQAAHAGVNISDEQSAEEFLDELASVKSTYFKRSFLSAPLQSASDLPTQVANPAKPSPQPRPASDESYDRPSQTGQLEVAPGITIRFDTEPDVQLEFSAEPLITPDPNGNFSFSTREGQTISLALPDGLRNEFAGVIAFDVTGLKPGASTTINLSIPSTLSMKENASGAYIRFNYDTNRFEEFVDLQGNPLYNFNDLNGDGIIDNVSLLMQDGDLQWDGDGAANGRVVDPGTIVTGEIDFKGTPHKDYITGNILSNTLKGSRGNDRILGDLGRDTIWGGRGHDRIDGGEGGDILIGGRGRDRFIYTSIEESNPFQADTIRRLRSNDAIDLRSIDANKLIEGRQNFLFIEKEKFSGTASELRATRSSLQADIDGDGKADFIVNLINSYRPNADQILL